MKTLAPRLPERWQMEQNRLQSRPAIRAGRFAPDETEDAILDSLIKPGGLVIDVRANIGRDTRRCSDLVRPTSRAMPLSSRRLTWVS